MYRPEDFVVDWQDAGEHAPINSYVALGMSGRNIGPCRVESVDRSRPAPAQETPQLPVGAQLDGGDAQGRMPGLAASLLAGDKTDLGLAW